MKWTITPHRPDTLIQVDEDEDDDERLPDDNEPPVTFSCLEELRDVPCVKRFIDDPSISGLYIDPLASDGFTILGVSKNADIICGHISPPTEYTKLAAIVSALKSDN